VKHVLKIWPQFYCRVADGSKTFEVRENDRGYQPGDEVVLREYNPETHLVDDGVTGYYREAKGYSGAKLEFKIGYVLPIDDKRVVFSLLAPPKPRED
jgi:hypothetical protein